MNSDTEKKINIGLTSAEVKEKTDNGLVNTGVSVKTKSYGRIIFNNAFSLFNLINVILLVCIFISGEIKNALFFLVVLSNFLISCIQEIRAKKIIEKLSLISAPKAYALRDGEIKEISVNEVVLGEILKIKNGNQVCSDCVILSGDCQVNESLITGESTPVNKQPGDMLLSGSFIVAGSVLAEVCHIKEDNYATKITLGAKYYKKSESVIMHSVKMIVRIIAVAVLPLTGLLVWTNFFRQSLEFSDAMVHTVAAVSAMIPGGLVLLVSIMLAVSVIKLSNHNTLAQDLYSVENLARVDMMLLDKTGTITEGTLKVDEIIEIDPDNSDEELLLSEFAMAMDDDNATMESIREYLHIEKTDDVNVHYDTEEIFTVPFSSERKWSLLYKKGQGSFILGATEFVLKDSYNTEGRNGMLSDILGGYTERGKRVVLFAKADKAPEKTETGDYMLPPDVKPLALIIIADKIREGAVDTFEYFSKENVGIKVISGDSAETVSMVAKQAGLKGAEKWVNASELDTYEKIEEAVDEYTVFGRVSPYQKLDIVKALKAKGHTVAMTGDGANDVLALKEADCSIAMQNGSEAARNVSSLVLIDSNFASLPVVLSEGRKAINNLQRSATLFLSKTTYSFILSIAFLFITSIVYPFESIQISIIGSITIGIPSFILALEPNNNRVENRFVYNVLKRAVPTGVLMCIAITFCAFFAHFSLGAGNAEVSTIATYVTLIIGLMVIINISGRPNLWKIALIAGLSVAAFSLVVLFPELFSLVELTKDMWIVICSVAAIFFVLHIMVIKLLVPFIDKKFAE